MYLKCIRANGFKSFAEKIELDINQGITGVVGPNGSGKSNIVDAVRWVMGEQSVKALRGDSGMTDVIFAGSKSRGAQTRASVSLVFDNSDHYLNSEFNEIEIKRVVYKTGENEYYINNTKVRLKDITDLFLDSGAGKESFNIFRFSSNFLYPFSSQVTLRSRPSRMNTSAAISFNFEISSPFFSLKCSS